MIGDDEKVLLIAAPNTAEYIKANDPDIKNALIICEFMEEGHVLTAAFEEWINFAATADTYYHEPGKGVEMALIAEE